MPEDTPDPGHPGTLLVKQIRSESPHVVTLTLVDPAGRTLPPWEAGAHLDLVLPSGTIRQYSLCGDDQDRTSYTIAVQHEPAGRGGSHEVHTVPLVGKELTVRGPRNHFSLARSEQHFLIAGGIGITPILAMARALERAGQSWQLLYCGHRHNMPFVDALQDIDPERVTVVETDQRGRPAVRDLISRLPAGTAVYCCGPASLISDVKAASEATGNGLVVRVERFAADPESFPVRTDGDRPVEVELARTGTTITVPADRTILEAVREVRPDVPFSCEEGYCGSCETRVLGGTPDHRDEVLGTNEQGRDRTMMICVSRATSERLLLDL
ncbi:PDR/VanB family oxidoreductase [Streptomyces scopuliridis]|uniref:PDR/VanB family oxidoreductase n=1 Tax=Streptomyces scopuliridis TaxID=452529 RepID=UPI00368807FF